MTTTAGGDLYQESSASLSTGTITLSGTSPSAPRTRPFSAAFDGKPIRVLIEHQSISTQFEVVKGVYTHSTKAFTRPTAEVIFGTAGAGANTDFSAGGLIVSIIQSWDDIEDIRARAYLTDGATFVPTAVDLSSTKEYDPYTQVGPVACALAAVTEIPGAYITVQITGDGSAITWSADFAEIQGGNLTVGDYAGFAGSRRLVIVWSAAQGKALVALSGEVSGGGGTWGSITGTLADQTDLQAALDAKAPSSSPTLSNPTFTGTVTVPDAALAIADTSGLQTALDAKAPTANPVFTGTVGIPDGALAIADTDGLQAALDAKQPLASASATITAATYAADTDDLFTLLPFDNATSATDQELTLPARAGIADGSWIDLVALADDTVHFPVTITAATADQLRSRPDTPGHDGTADPIQIGLLGSTSEFAAARALAVPGSKWLVTGHVRELTPALAPDQFGSLIQWHDALAATITDVGGFCSNWAQRAGLSGSYLQGTAGDRPTIVGTPGAADYGLRFDAADWMQFGQTNGWTADVWSLFLVFTATSDFTDFKDIWNSDVSYANTPRLSVFAATSPSINVGVDTATTDASFAVSNTRDAGLALVVTGNVGAVKVYRSDSLNRPTASYTTSTWTAARTRNLLINSTAAGSVTIKSVAEFNAALDAEQAMTLIRYARSERGWVS